VFRSSMGYFLRSALAFSMLLTLHRLGDSKGIWPAKMLCPQIFCLRTSRKGIKCWGIVYPHCLVLDVLVWCVCSKHVYNMFCRCRWVLVGRAQPEWGSIWVPISRLEPLLHVESPSQWKVCSLTFTCEFCYLTVMSTGCLTVTWS